MSYVDGTGDRETTEAPSERYSPERILRLIFRYRRAITYGFAAIMSAYFLLGILAYVASPVETFTTLAFRLEFDGADQGRYPNGMKFSNSEIIATPILLAAFDENQLSRFHNFTAFRNAITVFESNFALDRLQRAYNDKLSDVKLTPVERDRLETEYAMKRDAISRTEFAVQLHTSGRVSEMPKALRTKVLHDIVRLWGDRAMNEKGIGSLEVSILSPAIVDEADIRRLDYLVAVDVLRTKINRVTTNVNGLLELPGAQVARGRKDGPTLTELRAQLEDLRRFRLEPLLGRIRLRRMTRSPELVMEYVALQQAQARRERDEALARVTSLESAAGAYMSRSVPVGQQTPAAAGETETAPRHANVPLSGNALMPQMGENFLRQIVDLATNQKDIDYRQKLVEKINDVTVEELLPRSTEVRYYEQLTEFAQPLAGGSSGSPADVESLVRDYEALRLDVRKTIGEVNAIYQSMSRNLNPGGTVYTVTAPATSTSERAVSFKTIVLLGLLLAILALPLLAVACLVHYLLNRRAGGQSMA